MNKVGVSGNGIVAILIIMACYAGGVKGEAAKNNLQRQYCKQGSPNADKCLSYNILSIDAGSYNGLVSSSFIDYMEHYSYFYARAAYCIDERKSNKLSMAELFDYIAGSETGALIGSTLMIPAEGALADNQINKYFASDTMQYFKENSRDLY